MNVYDDSISKSGSLAKRPRKNVTFQSGVSDDRSPASKYDRNHPTESSLSRSGRKDNPDVEIEESIDESIPDGLSSMHESSASKIRDSGAGLSSSKLSRRSGKGKGVKSQIEEVREVEQDDSLDRGSVDADFQAEVDASIEQKERRQ